MRQWPQDAYLYEGATAQTSTLQPELHTVLENLCTDYAEHLGPAKFYSSDLERGHSVVAAIRDEVNYITSPVFDGDGQRRLDRSLLAVRRLPVSFETVSAIDRAIFGHTLEVLKSKEESDSRKNAWVSVSLCVGMDSPLITREQKMLRLQHAVRTGADEAEEYVRRIMPTNYAEQFIRQSSKHEKTGFGKLVGASALTLSLLFGSLLITDGDGEAAASTEYAVEASDPSAPAEATVQQATTEQAAQPQVSPEAQAIQEMIDRADTDPSKRTYIAFQYYINQGFTTEESAALIGNFLKESAGTMDPSIHQFGGGPGRGFVQWEGGRYDALVAFAAEQGKPWDDFGVQLDFVIHELNTNRSRALQELKDAEGLTGHEGTVYAVMHWYEGPANQSDEALQYRIDYAQGLLNTYTANLDRVNQERAVDAAQNITAGYGFAGSRAMTIYYQTRDDGEWGDQAYGEKDIAVCGCAPVAMSMAITTLTGDKDANPKVLADWFMANGGQANDGCTSRWLWKNKPKTINNDFGVQISPLGTSTDAVKQALSEGALIIMSQQESGVFTNTGHVMLIRAVTPDGKFLVADPNSKQQTENTSGWSADEVLQGLKVIDGNGFFAISAPK